jgi:molybdate transport system ATP-binding protein
MPFSPAKLRAHIRATDVMLATSKPAGLSALNVFAGTVEAVSDMPGASVDVVVRTLDAAVTARITRYSAGRLGIVPGKRVYAIVKAMSVQKPSVNPLHVGESDH